MALKNDAQAKCAGDDSKCCCFNRFQLLIIKKHYNMRVSTDREYIQQENNHKK